MQLTWKFKAFNALSVQELYAILKLRNEVFVVEQSCVYQDADNKDFASFHLAGWKENELAAYCRILPPGLSYQQPSIGRVVTSPSHRRSGYGRTLMLLAVEKTLAAYDNVSITISAQLYLKQFYESLGFIQVSAEYLEDNIPHIEMQYKA